MTDSAVVFAYHNVGVRCLRVLLDAGVDVRLVVTHEDDPKETVWFGSVAGVARDYGIPMLTPRDAKGPELLEALRAAAPEFLFSFYYRHMLPPALLGVPTRGAFNMHGSLLPKFRGRAPVNWAILHGERETGATLHVMHEKPDYGALVDQQAVPILQDDTAREVFDKVTVAAELVMARAWPALRDGTAVLREQRHVPGQYFSGRKPEDGRIPATAGARAIHDLVRAVAPPDYPGAFFDAGARRVVVARTRVAEGATGPSQPTFTLAARDGALWLDAADGSRLRVLQATLDGEPLDAATWAARVGTAPLAPSA